MRSKIKFARLFCRFPVANCQQCQTLGSGHAAPSTLPPTTRSIHSLLQGAHRNQRGLICRRMECRGHSSTAHETCCLIRKDSGHFLDTWCSYQRLRQTTQCQVTLRKQASRHCRSIRWKGLTETTKILCQDRLRPTRSRNADLSCHCVSQYTSLNGLSSSVAMFFTLWIRVVQELKRYKTHVTMLYSDHWRIQCKKKKKKLPGLSPRANYTDRVTATCRRT
jgi:hypothetical protein